MNTQAKFAAALLLRGCDEWSGKRRGTDINKATANQLDNLPGVSSDVAAAIINGRPYQNVDELIRVRGIGPKTLERIRPYVFVEQATP